MIIYPLANKVFAASIIAACILLTPVAAWSQEFETPKPAGAAKIHGRLAFGANYQLQTPVLSDGFLRFYKLSTFYGPIRVIGDELLKVRIKELAVLQFLDELKLDDEFNEKFDKAIVNALSFNQGSTTLRRNESPSINSGVKTLFQDMAQNLNSDNSKTTVSSTNISRAKRRIAFHLRINPYTDFTPLKNQLNVLSRAGEKGVRLIAAASASLVKNSTKKSRKKHTPSPLQILIRDKTPSELKAYNRKALIDMDIDELTVDAFLSNANYTITGQTAMSLALNQLEKVSGRQIFLHWAAFAKHREVAFFHKKTAELFANYHENISPLKKFISVAGFPLAQSLKGKIIGLLNVDELVWTTDVAKAMASINSALKAQNLSSTIDLHITGIATKMAKSNLKNLKWNVFTKAKFR